MGGGENGKTKESQLRKRKRKHRHPACLLDPEEVLGFLFGKRLGLGPRFAHSQTMRFLGGGRESGYRPDTLPPENESVMCAVLGYLFPRMSLAHGRSSAKQTEGPLRGGGGQRLPLCSRVISGHREGGGRLCAAPVDTPPRVRMKSGRVVWGHGPHTRGTWHGPWHVARARRQVSAERR